MIQMVTILLVSITSLVLGGLLGLYFGLSIEHATAHWREERNRKAAKIAIEQLGEIEKECANNRPVLNARADGVVCGLLINIGRSDVSDVYERVKGY